MQIYSQKGVGLMEVLVALLILALVILGFVALQLRAVDAASEASNRIQAMNLARDLSEKIRINNDRAAFTTYQQSMQSDSLKKEQIKNCYSTQCTSLEKARFDVHQMYLQAENLGMKINMISCPGIQNNRQCVYVSWGKTTPTHNTGEHTCTIGEGRNFSYDGRATCVVVETYS